MDEREAELFNRGVDHFRANPPEQTAVDYWMVESPAGEPRGDVIGGGPTLDTRYKAISRSDVWMNPASAPSAGYASTLAEAAALLLEAGDI